MVFVPLNISLNLPSPQLEGMEEVISEEVTLFQAGISQWLFVKGFCFTDRFWLKLFSQYNIV